MPYTFDETTNLGGYRPDHLLEQYNFYQNTANIAHSQVTFGWKKIEASPLNRVLEQAAPGDAWYPGDSFADVDRKTVKFDTRPNFNSLDGDILVWKVLPGDVLSNTGAYLDETMMVSITTDEHGSKVQEFTTKTGQVVLKQVENTSEGTDTDQRWLKTYYAYDDFGNLRFVLPPELNIRTSAGFLSTDAGNQDLLDTWAFQYKYDFRNRMEQKRVPGAEWVYMVYDQWDRLVLTQDGEQRLNNKWSFTKYDHLNRPIMTGIYTDATILATLRTNIDVSSVRFEDKDAIATGYTLNLALPVVVETDLLTVTYYDDYSFPHASDPAFAYVQELGNVLQFTEIRGQVTGMKTRVMADNSWIRSITYYDNRYRVIQSISENQNAATGGIDRVTNRYDFTGKVLETQTSHSPDSTTTRTVKRDYTYDHGDRLMSVRHSFSIAPTWENIVNLTVTGDYIEKTGGKNAFWDAGISSMDRLYSDKDGYIEVIATTDVDARIFGLATPNNSTGFEEIDYGFYTKANGNLYYYNSGVDQGLIGTFIAGDVLRVEKKQWEISYLKNGTVLISQPFTGQAELIADFSFKNKGGRYDNIIINFGNIILSNTYNDLGELIEKDLHVTSDTRALQSVDYRYNLRGWLTSINNSQLTINSINDDDDDFFGMELSYADGFAQGQYNGNIAGVKWQNQLDGKERSYGYLYDPLNRIKFGDYSAYNGVLWTDEADRYQVHVKGYDLNGNIKDLARNGLVSEGVYGLIDDLAYDYTGTGNQLKAVNDPIADIQGRGDFYDGAVTAEEYIYDENGNMKSDANKGITNIDYNHLNLPKKVDFGAGKYIEYIYDAAGIKLRQKVYDNSTLQKTTDYMGEFVYEDLNDGNGSLLQFIQHEEGRVVPDYVGDPWVYQYHIKDHLGNVRVTFSSDDVDQYLATFEIQNDDPKQTDLLENLDQSKVVVYAPANQTVPGNEAVRLNNTYMAGPGLMLMVGKGDVIDLETYAYYEGGSGYSSIQDLGVMVTAISGAFGGLSGGSEVQQAIYDVFNGVGAALLGGTADDNVPAAYLNYVTFDDSFTYVPASSGFIQISASANTAKELLSASNISIGQNGFVYVYLSYESTSTNWVYFDDLKVTHTKSPIIQTDDYYPFGLTFNSYQRTGSRANDFLYNGFEKQDELDLGLYDYMARYYDPAIGRFINVDPAADLMRRHSPYAFDNPIRFTDPDGMVPTECEGCKDKVVKTGQDINVTSVSAVTDTDGKNEYSDHSPNTIQRVQSINTAVCLILFIPCITFYKLYQRVQLVSMPLKSSTIFSWSINAASKITIFCTLCYWCFSSIFNQISISFYY